MPNLVAISQATAKINRGGGIRPPPPGIECFKSPRSDRVNDFICSSGFTTPRKRPLSSPHVSLHSLSQKVSHQGSRCLNSSINRIVTVLVNDSHVLIHLEFTSQTENYGDRYCINLYLTMTIYCLQETMKLH